MKRFKDLLKTFIDCHEGFLNKALHIIGLLVLFYGLLEKSLLFVLLGAFIQELGHVYQYIRTKEKKASPWTCLKPQSVFAYPLLVVAIIYVLF